MSKFVEKYQEFRERNYNPQESFGLVCLHIEAAGTMEDLTELQKVYTEDTFKEWDELIKEANINEKNPVA